uniref:Uncharacterized protein n=1 Tax=Anguilla anguilla TaxID=7936 RepID=A0A0E9PXM7_ANGAN
MHAKQEVMQTASEYTLSICLLLGVAC